MTLPATPPAAPRKRQPARLRVAAWAAAAAVALAPAVLTAAGAQTVPCALSEDQARADLTLTTDAALVARARGELAELNGQAALPVDTLASLLNLPLGHDVGGGVESWSLHLDGMTLTVAPEAANRASMTCAAGTNPPGLDPEAAFLNPGDGRVYLPLSALQPFGATATLDPTGVNLNAPAATLNLGPLKTRLPSTGASLDGWRTAASGATRLDGGIAFPLALALAADQRLNFRPTDGQLFLDATPVAALYDGTPSNLVTWGGGTLVPLTALQAAGLNARQEGDHLVMTAGNLDFPIAIPEFPARASTASLKIEADEVARLQGRRRLRAAWTPVTEAAILVNGQVYLPLTPTAARWPGLTLNGTALQLNGVTIARLYEPPKAGQGLVRYHEATYLPAAVLPGFTPQDGQLTIEDGPASITLTLPPTTPRLNFQTLKTGATTPTDPTAIPTRAYTVQPGDTLYHLAQRFHTTISALQAANHLTGTTLQTGQELIVPESW